MIVGKLCDSDDEKEAAGAADAPARIPDLPAHGSGNILLFLLYSLLIGVMLGWSYSASRTHSSTTAVRIACVCTIVVVFTEKCILTYAFLVPRWDRKSNRTTKTKTCFTCQRLMPHDFPGMLLTQGQNCQSQLHTWMHTCTIPI